MKNKFKNIFLKLQKKNKEALSKKPLKLFSFSFEIYISIPSL